MNSKKVYILGVLLLLIVGILVVQEKLRTQKPAEHQTRFMPDVSDKSISAITIKEGDARISLKKKGDVWVVAKPQENASSAAASLSPIVGDSSKATSTASAGYPVDSASIVAAVEKLVTLEKSTLISENPEKQTIFEVDTVKGIVVEVFGSGEKFIGTVIIGKSGPDYNSHYIRKLGSNSVYMVPGGVRYAFFTDLSRWRNKSMVKFDKATAQGLTLAKKDGTLITLAHGDSSNTWEILQPIKNPAKADVVENVIEKLSNLIATDFQDEILDDATMGFDAPELAVTVSFKNGSSRNIVFGKKNTDNKYWVKIEGNDQLYLINDYSVNEVNKNLDELKGEPPVAASAPEAVKK